MASMLLGYGIEYILDSEVKGQDPRLFSTRNAAHRYGQKECNKYPHMVGWKVEERRQEDKRPLPISW